MFGESKQQQQGQPANTSSSQNDQKKTIVAGAGIMGWQASTALVRYSRN